MAYQLPLFALDEPAPHDPIRLLRDGAALVLSISGGKDSDAMCHHLLECRQTEGWSGAVALVHADLGRAEWHNTTEYVYDLAQRTGVPLHIVRWTQGDLIDRIWQRYYADPSRPACRPVKSATAPLISNVRRSRAGYAILTRREKSSVPLGCGPKKVPVVLKSRP